MISILIGIILFIVGYLVGNTSPWPAFSMDRNVSLPQILTILNTFFIALMFNHFLARRKENKTFEKKFLSQKIEEILSIVEFFEKITEDTEHNYLELVAKCKIVNIKTQKMLSHSINLKFENNNAIYAEKFQTPIKNLRHKATHINEELVVNRNNKAIFKKIRVDQIENQCSQLQDILYSYLISINEKN